MKQTPMPAMAKTLALRGVNFVMITPRCLLETPWLVAFFGLPCTALSMRQGRMRCKACLSVPCSLYCLKGSACWCNHHDACCRLISDYVSSKTLQGSRSTLNSLGGIDAHEVHIVRMVRIERFQRPISGTVRRQIGEIIGRDRNLQRVQRANVARAVVPHVRASFSSVHP
jgi:hypothetical protein